MSGYKVNSGLHFIFIEENGDEESKEIFRNRTIDSGVLIPVNGKKFKIQKGKFLKDAKGNLTVTA